MALKSLEKRRRADELNFSMSFLQRPFPITQVHCVLLGLDFNFSLPLCTVSSSFKVRLSFAKEGLLGGIHLPFGDIFSPEEQRQLKNLRRKNTKSPEGSNKILLQP